MGQTPNELEHQIEDLRSETTAIIGEIQERVRETTDLRVQMERRPWIPYAFGGLIFSALGLVGFALFRAVARRRAEERGLRGFWRRVNDRVTTAWDSLADRNPLVRYIEGKR